MKYFPEEMAPTKLTLKQRTTIAKMAAMVPRPPWPFIALEAGCTIAQVKYWHKMDVLRDIGNHKSPGRMPQMADALGEEVTIATYTEPALPGRRLASQFGISASSIYRLRRLGGFRFLLPETQPPLSDEHKAQRLAFASWMLEPSLLTFDPDAVIFSDESTVKIDIAGRRIWRIPGFFDETVTVDVVGHPTSVMIWGAIGHNFKSKLIFFHGSVNSHTYTEALEQGQVIAQMVQAMAGRIWRFQQDNASPHVSQFTHSWMTSHNVPLLPNWPARSPDLSPIEQMWFIVKARLDFSTVTDQASLIEAIQRTWDSIEMEHVNHLVDSLKARLQV